MHDARGHRHVDVGVFGQRYVQAERADPGQRRVRGGQAEHRGAVVAGDGCRFHQFAGASGIGNDHEQITGMGDRGEHALHEHIAVRGDRQVEAKELVLSVQRDGGRGAQAEEMDLACLDHQIHRVADRLRVDRLASAVQRGDGAAEDLPSVGFGPVIGFHCLADVGRATGQALRQLDL